MPCNCADDRLRLQHSIRPSIVWTSHTSANRPSTQRHCAGAWPPQPRSVRRGSVSISCRRAIRSNNQRYFSGSPPGQRRQLRTRSVLHGRTIALSNNWKSSSGAQRSLLEPVLPRSDPSDHMISTRFCSQKCFAGASQRSLRSCRFGSRPSDRRSRSRSRTQTGSAHDRVTAPTFSTAKQIRDIITEKRTICEINFICFRLLSATDSSRAHFENNYRPNELGKAEQHCSVSNSAQTYKVVGGSVSLWVTLFGPEEGTRFYAQSNPSRHDDGSAIGEHAVARNRKRALLWELALVRGSRKLRPGSQSSGCRMVFVFHGWRTEGSGTRLGWTEHSTPRS